MQDQQQMLELLNQVGELAVRYGLDLLADPMETKPPAIGSESAQWPTQA